MLSFGKPEAYVTFTASRSAHSAYIDNEEMADRGINRFHILPADTWVQPNETTNELPMGEDEEPQIFVLNDDCLEHIQRFVVI